jgi:hypothetical protein
LPRTLRLPLAGALPARSRSVSQTAIGSLVAAAPARAAFFLSLAILTAGLALVGPRAAEDTRRFLTVGHRLWSALLGSSTAQSVTWDVFTTMYLFEHLVMAAGDALFGNAFPLLFVVVNIVLYAFAVYLCFRIWAMIAPFTSARATAVALLVLFGCVDVPMWTFYLLGDVTFFFLLAAFWFLLARAVLFGGTRGWALALVVAAVAALVRPTAIVVIAFWFTAAAYMFLRARGVGPRTIATVFLVVPFGVAEFVWPYFVYRVAANGGHAPVLRAAFDELLPWYLNGSVVCDRLETYLAPPVVYLDFVRLTLVRLLYFFFPLRTGYSVAHNMALVLYAPMLVGFACVGWRQLRKRDTAHASLAFLLLAFMYYFGLFHSMTYVDYDWRYQIPAMLSAFVLSGIGIARVFEGEDPLSCREFSCASPSSPTSTAT